MRQKQYDSMKDSTVWQFNSMTDSMVWQFNSMTDSMTEIKKTSRFV